MRLEGSGERRTMQDAEVQMAIERLRKRLLDLTARNRLLNYRKTKRSTVQIVDELPNQIYERLVVQRKTFTFLPRSEEPTHDDVYESEDASSADSESEIEIDIPWSVELPEDPGNEACRDARHSDSYLQTDLTQDDLDITAEHMRRASNSVIEETGINHLYMAIGMLEWTQMGASRKRCTAPLLLIPVAFDKKFDGRHDRYTYSVRYTGDDIEDNISLREMLRQDFGISLPVFDMDEGEDDASSLAARPEAYFKRVRAAVSSQSAWRIRREALIGFFAFHKIRMYKDLDPDSWGDEKPLARQQLLRALVEGMEQEPTEAVYPPEYPIDECDEAKNILIGLDADSSQLSALLDIASGKSLVVEGPPGTGKSQTIANAIAWAMSEGKTVLFVAEKLAALEVVYRKLKDIRLDPFCLELYSHNADKKSVYESLNRSMKERMAIKRDGDHDAVVAKREKLLKILKEYLDAVNRRAGPLGESVHDIFGKVVRLRERGARWFNDAVVDTKWNKEQYEERLGLLRNIVAASKDAGGVRNHPWRGFYWNNISRKEVPQVEDRLREAHRALARIVAVSHRNHSRIGDIWPKMIAQLNTDWNECADLLCAAPFALEEELREILSDPSRCDIVRQYLEDMCAWERLWAEVHPRLAESLQSAMKSAMQLLSLTNPGELLDNKNMTKERLLTLRMTLDRVRESLYECSRMEESFNELGIGVENRLSSLVVAVQILLLLEDPAAHDVSKSPRRIFQSDAPNVLKEAMEYANELVSLRREIGKAISIRDAPQGEELSLICTTMRVHRRNILRIFNREYRRCRRIVAGCLRTSSLRPEEIAELLDKVEQLREKEKAFAQDVQCQRLFGALFQGVATDWKRVQDAINWIVRARRLGLNRENALQLIQSHAAQTMSIQSQEADSLLKSIENDMLQEDVARVLRVESKEALRNQNLSQLLEKVTHAYEACQAALASLEAFNFPQDTCIGDIRVIMDATVRVYELEKHLRTDEHYRATLGANRCTVEYDCSALKMAMQWCDRVRESACPDKLATWLLQRKNMEQSAAELREDLHELRDASEVWTRCIRSLSEWGKVDAGWASEHAHVELLEAQRRLEAALESIETLPSWSLLCRLTQRADYLNMEVFIRAMYAGEIEPDALVDTFERAFYEALATHCAEQDPVLQEFSRSSIENVRRRFQELDRRLLETSRQLVAARVAQRELEYGVSSGPVRNLTELGLIRHEIRKQRRHCKIRQLVKRAPRSLLALKPCVMMSPLSVAQYLAPNAVEFDLVIMDEASQIRPEDALGAVARGRQLIVVGDPKQLPPTTFFDRIGSEEVMESDETNLDDAESILDVTMKAYPRARRLRWHYRSQHESLIQFSNERFYDGDLIVPPSPTKQRGRLGVYCQAVKGAVYAYGRNEVEAEAVAKAVVEHAKRCPDESLGVGCFNIKQRDLIEYKLDEIYRKDPLAREMVDRMRQRSSEPLFIKNLENLQGDERDVIYISYTYGRDRQSGKVFQRFGPLSQENGWRRLNVLVTRAKKRVEVFASLTPEEILLGDTTREGVRCLREYLEYAMSGQVALRGVSHGTDFESPFEEAVAAVIQRLGYDVVPQVGVTGFRIDLGVLKPGCNGEYILGVECDGATYHSAKSARDRDRLRQEIIESRGWRLHRIWSTDWFQNQEQEIRRLQEALEQAHYIAVGADSSDDDGAVGRTMSLQ